MGGSFKKCIHNFDGKNLKAPLRRSRNR